MADRLAVDVGGTKLALAVVNASGEITARRLSPTPLTDAGELLPAEPFLDWVRAEAREFWLESGTSEPDLVGVSTPGIVDPTASKAIWDHLPEGDQMLCWANAITERFPASEFQLLNDGNAFAWGEHNYGVSSSAGLSRSVGRILDWGSGTVRELEAAELLEPPSTERGVRRLVGVCIGTGIGAGVIIDGKIYSGRNGGAGELGQVRAQMARDEIGAVADGDGMLWPRATLSSMAGGKAIANRYKHLSGTAGPSASTLAGVRWVAHRASQGDELAAAVLAVAGERIAAALADLTAIIAPDRIVIGGGIGPVLFPVILSKMRSELCSSFVSTRIATSTLGADAHLLGAVTDLRQAQI